MTLLGGMGTVIGPVVGAFIIETLENYLTGMGNVTLFRDFTIDLSSKVPVVIGFIFVICVLVFRRGIVGEIGQFLTTRGNGK